MSKKARSHSRSAHWYPDWVYNVREDITRANMDLYDRQQAQIEARCLEINPNYHTLPWLDRMDVCTQARKDLGMPYLDLDTGKIRSRKEARA